MSEIKEYVHDHYGDDYDKKVAGSNLSPIEKHRKGRGKGINWRKYYENRPTKWKRPKEWDDNPLDN